MELLKASSISSSTYSEESLREQELSWCGQQYFYVTQASFPKFDEEQICSAGLDFLGVFSNYCLRKEKIGN